MRVWRRQEAFCFGYGLLAFIAILAGILPVENVVKVYFVAVGVVGLNQLRTLGAHRFRHRGEELTFLEQLLDSVNYPRWPLLTGLWAPIGLRYHALHHLFPSIPYHNLHEAHLRLMAQLPADSPYRQTVSPGLWAALSVLWRSARSSGAVRASAAREVQAAG
jgi:fatty acid desaturase